MGTSSIREHFEQWLTAGGNRVGQVSIQRRAEGGFMLTHCEDRTEESSSKTEVFTRPEDARALAQYDDAGAYRPLKTAPNLRHGWRLELEGIVELLSAIEFFYPAMPGIWSAYQSGALHAVPLRETLNRQTGMYAITRKLSNEAANGVISRCCRSDGGCLKTILWSLEPGVPVTSLPTQKFDPAADQLGEAEHAFPLLCQEACNLLIAAARKELKRP